MDYFNSHIAAEAVAASRQAREAYLEYLDTVEDRGARRQWYGMTVTERDRAKQLRADRSLVRFWYPAPAAMAQALRDRT